ncbi:alpha/beta fold hydrolase [Rhizobium oryziradicis]|uniref:Esterase n=1 Tax=Rhizobium oryziradicis TaxID=1867956 RepID=A0A1Q8ZYI0_9HYPH|nr:alpha/beta hydrolase [Rhizobium oryziradicis]OLP46976.1 esterase [Rhizobium oryziradicis]
MAQSILTRLGAKLNLVETGQGLPVVFQHGLGGDFAQVAQTFPNTLNMRRITLECRGHGGSTLGDVRPFSIAMFANDVLAAVDQLGIERFVAGGISMGAAIALHLAHFHKDRVSALLLVRPAWSFEAKPANMQPIRMIADLLQSYPIEEAKQRFSSSSIALALQQNAPDNLASLLGYFERDDATAFAEVLTDIASDGPGVSKAEAETLSIPTLIVGNQMDAIHPLSTAVELAATLPDAQFVEVAAKAADKALHFAQTQESITQFLTMHCSEKGQL